MFKLLECGELVEYARQPLPKLYMIKLLLNLIVLAFLKMLSNISQGAHVVPNTLQFRKAFIVFDDIDNNLKQLEYLVGKHHCFGRGSRVLITTRNCWIKLMTDEYIKYSF